MVHTQIFLAFQQTTTTRAQSWKSRRASGDIAIRLSRVSLRPYFSQKFFQPSFHSHPPCYISYARNASPFIKIPLKLSPLLLFLETKRISPPARINKIREEEEGRREEEKEDGARILSSFLSLKRIIYQSPISKSEDTSCDPLGHPWSEQGLDTNRGTKGLARKWVRTAVKGAKINPVNTRDKALSPKRPAREEIQEKTSPHDPLFRD